MFKHHKHKQKVHKSLKLFIFLSKLQWVQLSRLPETRDVPRPRSPALPVGRGRPGWREATFRGGATLERGGAGGASDGLN